MAARTSEGYVVRGQKVFTSRALYSDLMLLLARTAPVGESGKPSDGLSLFIVDMRAAGDTLKIRPLDTMMNHSTTEVFFDGVELPADALLGEEGRGFKYVLETMNAERILIAAERVGDGRWFVERASEYATERVVFGRPIGQIRVSSSRSLAPMPRLRPPNSCEALQLSCLTLVYRVALGPTWPSCWRQRRRGRRRMHALILTVDGASHVSITSSANFARLDSTR